MLKMWLNSYCLLLGNYKNYFITGSNKMYIIIVSIIQSKTNQVAVLP
jgi:hypothetical protein